MEEAVDEELLDEGRDERPRDGLALDARVELVGMRGLDPVDEVHHEDPLGAQLRIHRGHADAVDRRQDVRQPPRVVGLGRVVELLQDPVGELLDDGDQPEPACGRDALVGQSGQLLHDAQVGAHLGLDVRAAGS